MTEAATFGAASLFMKKLPEMSPKNRYWFSFLLFLACHSLFSQLDSVMLLVSKESDPIRKNDLLLRSAERYQGRPQAIALGSKAYAFSESSGQDEQIAGAALFLANEYFYLSVPDSVARYSNIAVEKYRKLHDRHKLFDALQLKTINLINNNKVKNAFEESKELIKLAEELKNPEMLASVYLKMGLLFKRSKDLEKSSSYFNKALKIYSQSHNWKGIESCYLNLGINHSNKSYNDLAIEYFERGLEVNKKTNDLNHKALLLNGMAGVYYELSNLERALQYYQQVLEISKKNNYIDLLPNVTNNIGTVLMEMNRFNEAKPYLIEAYYLSRNQKNKSELALYSSFNLAQLYEDLGDYKSAMEYMNLYVSLNDSLNNIQNTKNLSEIEAKYQNEKKEEQNALLNERLRNKSMQIYFALGGIALLSVLAFFIFRGLKEKQRANRSLEEKNKIIEEKSIIVEQQHKDITDSIKYAERIQAAILPPERLWKSILPHSFVFYQPKDILSGDFYWIEETEDHIFIAAADCTGHGVPGALMSIVNYNLLNRAILEKGLTDGGKILDSINGWLTQSLHQSYQESAVRDGMDLSLCVIDKQSNMLNFAGAFNSIYLIRDGVLEELTSDKQPVGAFIEDNIKPFHNKYVQLGTGDVVYMFTDGYADQFGGEKGKKYKYKKLQALLTEIHTRSFHDQKLLVADSINTWKGNLEQIDDMLLLGFKWK
jgi:serine phosphatase RsbU (regulator of sigma subunit)